MPTPIFILGVQRSGTTWLANLLSAHSQIVSVQHPQHFGVHESGYFVHVDGRFGDLRHKTNFVEFVEVMSASDYFSLAGADRDYLYSLYPASYADVFRAVMDRFAEENQAEFWLEKSPGHTLQVEKLASLYPDARFIAIKRDAEQVVASTIIKKVIKRKLSASALVRRFRVFRFALRWAHTNRVIDRFAAYSDRIRVISYDDLKRDTGAMLADLCAFIGVSAQAHLEDEQFERDTSFNQYARDTALSPDEKVVLKLGTTLGALVPLPILDQIQRREVERQLRQHDPLPDWFFRVTRASDAEDVPLGRSVLRKGEWQ